MTKVDEPSLADQLNKLTVANSTVNIGSAVRSSIVKSSDGAKAVTQINHHVSPQHRSADKYKLTVKPRHDAGRRVLRSLYPDLLDQLEDATDAAKLTACREFLERRERNIEDLDQARSEQMNNSDSSTEIVEEHLEGKN